MKKLTIIACLITLGTFSVENCWGRSRASGYHDIYIHHPIHGFMTMPAHELEVGARHPESMRCNGFGTGC
jgi:hypothetical protein